MEGHTSLFGTKGIKQGVDRRRGQGSRVPTTLLQDAVEKRTVDAAIAASWMPLQPSTGCLGDRGEAVLACWLLRWSRKEGSTRRRRT